MKQRRFGFGFTLAELLLALALLGIISAFAIPKVLQSSVDNQKKAVFKESIAMISDITNQGRMEGVFSGSYWGGYVMGKINAVKVCDSDSSTQGCWDQSVQGTPPFESVQPGVILANGARVVGFSDCCQNAGSSEEWSNGYIIDWNGLDGPNAIGEDQLHIYVCFGNDPCSEDALHPPVPPGHLNTSSNLSGDEAVNDALYDSVFDNS